MQLTIPTPPDFSFAETLSAHGWRRLLPFLWNEDTHVLERVEELPGGSVALLQIHALHTHVRVESDADQDASMITQQVRRMLQLDVPLSGFHAYCLSRPELTHIVECQRGRMLRCPTLFEDCVKVIATVNTTWAQTIAMTTRIVNRFGSPLPSDSERYTFPTPQQIAAVSFEDFAAAARMGYRNAYVYHLATAISAGALDLEAWQKEELSAEELRKRLLSLSGIGPYGAACLMLYLGRPEQVNADSWARMLLGKELGRPVTDKEVHTYFEPHGEWRGLVYNFYPWKE